MMNPSSLFRAALFALVLVVTAGCLGSSETAVVTERPTPPPSTEGDPAPDMAAQPEAAGLDTVTARRFDQGKMWTFDDPPADYFAAEYGFEPDPLWFDRARLAALRFADYCSASFVSPGGLIMTNHHCARESITDVSQEGEDLLEDGFYAETLEAERAVDDLFVEQLIQIEDVTDDVYEAAEQMRSNESEAAAEARQRQAQQIQERLNREAEARDSTLRVQVVELYSGGRYSAYTYRRHDDVRLVMAPEEQVGYYGGSDDNFTYPRYTYDVSFFRAYDAEGNPLQTKSYFEWDTGGAREGDPVFVVGNPGSTDRFSTTAQLAFQRDYALPQRLSVLRTRADILEDYVRANPDEAETYDLRNTFFSIQNSIKSTEGELEGLRDSYLVARREAAQRQLRDSIIASDSLSERYGSTMSEIERLQRSKEVTTQQSAAFTAFTSAQVSSRILTRALYGYFYNELQKRPGVPKERLEQIREEALKYEDWPAAVEEPFIAARLREMQSALGSTDPTVRRVLQGRTPEQVAQRLAQNSALIDSTGFADLLGEGYLNSGDPSVAVIRPIASLFLELNRQQQDYQLTEESLAAQLAQARFAVMGAGTPPDASFSLRIADGRVEGYPYNGTRAPAFTTFLGLYDHYYAYDVQTGLDAWDLPERWTTPPDSLALSTPLNLVSTNDIAGGNSGSPLLNEDLEIVGLIFDSNVEALPNTYLYRNEAARAISVDARGILEGLEHLYDATGLLRELTTGEMPEARRADAAEEMSEAAAGEK